MWDAFLDRTCYSCIGLRNRPSFCKRKNDLYSVEYLRYIRRDILSCLEIPMKNSKQSPRKGTTRPSQSYYEKYKNEQNVRKKQFPVYFKVDLDAFKEKESARRSNSTKDGNCSCWRKPSKNEGIPKPNSASIQGVDTSRLARVQDYETMVCKKVCKEHMPETIDKKDVDSAYKSHGSKFKKSGEKTKDEKRRETKPSTPTPPAPVLKLKKRREVKKGAVIHDRSPSMPLYKDLLSRLNLAGWKLYWVSFEITK